MYYQGYLDPARVRNQSFSYPVPNYPAYAGITDDIKKFGTVYYDGLMDLKIPQIVGAIGGVMLVAAPMIKGKKKIAKQIPLSQKQAVQAAGGIMVLYSLYSTYSQI